MTPETSNPYVGPYAFEEKNADLFFGRDEEAKELLPRVISERIVVLYSPSGAGKTSLLNARLVPALRKKKSFHVFPVARVGMDLPPGVSPANAYSFNAISMLAGDRADSVPLQDLTLDGFLRLPSEANGKDRVLVLDQFEEILKPDHWEDQRRAFFQQLRQALLDDPSLSLVLSLREDYLAGLDPYAALLPDQLRTRFRLDRLRRGRAVEAVRRPAEAAGRPFEEGVAERLVENLSQEHRPGEKEMFPGEFVEPVQLQVVCYELWKNLPNRPGKTITEQDCRELGNVDQALERFYDSAVAFAAGKTGVPPMRIRRWCGTALITPNRIRSQVSEEAETSSGLPNDAVKRLLESHLIRREKTRGAIWYELAHDRFIDPIRQSNKKAQPSEVNRLAEDAQKWDRRKRDPSFLYRGQQLKAAQNLAGPGSGIVSGLDREFLIASREAESAEQAREARRLRIVVAALSVLVLTLVALSFYAWRQNRLARSKGLAMAAIERMKEDPDTAFANAIAAADTIATPEAENALHQLLADPSLKARQINLIAAQSARAFAFDPEGLRFAAVGKSGSVKVWDSSSRRPILTLTGSSRSVTSIALASGGRGIATGDSQGRVVLWSPDGRPLRNLEGDGSAVNALEFSPDGSLLAVTRDAPEVTLWNPMTGKRARTLSDGHSDLVFDVAFSADGRRVATAGADHKALVWDVATGKTVGDPFDHPAEVTGVAFSPQGTLATSCADGYWRLWTNPSKVLPHSGWVWDLDFSPDGRYVATGGYTGPASFGATGKIWDAETGREIRSVTLPCGQAKRVRYVPRRGSQDPTLAIACDPPEMQEDARGKVFFWNQLSGAASVLRASSPAGNVSFQETGFSADGRFVLATDRKGMVWIWDRAGSSQSLRQAPHPARETSGGHLLLYETPSGPIRLRNRGEGGADVMAFSADGARLARRKGNTLQIWNATEIDKPVLSREIQGTIQELALSPDGQRLAAIISEDRSIQLWDAANGHLLDTLFEGLSVTRLAFSPDGRRLAGVTNDGFVRIWDLEKRRELFKLRETSVTSITYSPDGRWLAIATSSGTIRLEPMRLEDMVVLAQQRVPKSLMRLERLR